jgi:hypothetical protein
MSEGRSTPKDAPAWSNIVFNCWPFAEVKKPAKEFYFLCLMDQVFNSFISHPEKHAMPNQNSNPKVLAQDHENVCHFLSPGHIQMIDEALRSLGEYGEVRLVIEKGRLRFLVTQKSYDTLKWQPGIIVKDFEP